MANFSPDHVTFGDLPGYGTWDTGHYREHLQFVQLLAGQATPFLLADYDFSAMLTDRNRLRDALILHQASHNVLSQQTGISALDFSGFDLQNPDDFYSFLGYHSESHRQLRQAFGIS